MSDRIASGVCDCLRSAASIDIGGRCPTCRHPRDAHDYDAGCTDGVDHPGSVEAEVTATLEFAPHGPSAEQWARGIALLATATMFAGHPPVLDVERKGFASAVETHTQAILNGGYAR